MMADERECMASKIRRTFYNQVSSIKSAELGRFEERYEILQSISAKTTNGYEEIFSARNRLTGMLVAVKKINKIKLRSLSKTR